MYQVWDKDDVNKMNAKRQVGYVSAKEWVTLFKKINNSLEENDKLLFTPTTIMETEYSNYAFVIHKAYFNSCDKVIFTVSTKEISLQNNTSKKLVQLPLGKCNHVRFDIDYSAWYNDFKWIECYNSGTCTPEKARSSLIEPPYMWYDYNNVIINFNLLQQVYENKKGKDMLDDQLKNYITDINKYAPYYRTCNFIMGEGCGNGGENYTNETISFTRWKNTMKSIGIKCPGERMKFEPICTTGCFQITDSGYDLFDGGRCS
jgi:hypothetical protein